ncbi:TIGR03773 family transporter-associated surface protein [Actinoplanes sp. TRM 88003]|uniref:TIGR03773 family transporter-associated surface protein n=1 Tax=Paractinoplanes aksuensis TaxID=2939490 RepID=A0ABT1E429_9ACTN|nr:TIGR03773 family transporter-associated surface protein [Actinoplanes aksuensis]MCO8277792.1 TIGR03773 family transporter-associated surface protein [Actinoplanes aksuensis]
MTRRTLLKTVRLTMVAATASFTALLPATAPATANPADPHVDGADLVSLSLESGALRLAFRGGSGAVDPETLRFTAQDGPVGAVPDDAAFAFLGKPGAPVWSLMDDGSRLPALDTTGVDRGQVADGSVTLELVSVDGPGTFAAYSLSSWGRPSLLLDSDGPRSARLPAGRRIGGLAWLFGAAGDYRLTLRASARTGTGPVSDETTYRVRVPGRAPAATSTPPAAAPDAAAPAAPRAAANEAPSAAVTANAAPAAAAGRKVISDGHVDMGPQLAGGKLRIRLKDDSTTPPTWRELSDVTLRVTDKARIDVPSGPGYAFLGQAGEKAYLLPQSQQAGIVWPGWNTQHESVVKGTRGNVTWRLTKVSGPGEFKLFLTGSFGTPEVVFDSDKSLPQQLAIAPNTHAHGNWAFTKAGTYRLTVDMAATTTGGTRVSDTRTLTLAVGNSTDTSGGTASDGSGSSSGPGAGSGNAKGGGNLAKTGTDIMSIAAGGGLLLTVGALTLVLTRRRNRSTTDPS